MPWLALLLAAAPPPAFDVLVKETSARGTPIVLDIFATWCQPCERMRREVFPDPKVVTALEGMRLVAYDAESGPGIEVARRFGVTDYPTVLVLTPDGTKVERILRRDVAGFVAELETLKPLAKARFHGEPPANATAEVWYAAAKAVEADEPRRALGYFRRAQKADPGNGKGVALRAAAAALPLETEAECESARARVQAGFLVSWPKASDAVKRLRALAGLVRYRGVDPKLLGAPLEAVRKSTLAGTDADRANDLAYLLLELGDLAGAKAVVARLEVLAPRDAAIVDTVAEVAFQSGDRDRAAAFSRKALLLAEKKDAADLEKNLTRYLTETPSLPTLPPPEPDPREAQRQRQLDSTAVASRLREKCAPNEALVDAVVRLSFGEGGVVSRAVAFGPKAPAPLLSCLEKAAVGLDGASLAEEPWADVPVQFGVTADGP